MTSFSVLISVYNKEEARHLDVALESVWENQTLRPDEIVLVEDGPLTHQLNGVVNAWQNKLGDLMVVVKLEENMGLGEALRIGLNACRSEYVARMDSDDLAESDRFETQVAFLRANPLIDLVGGQVAEFEINPDRIHQMKYVPLNNDEIVCYSKSRNPINHPTVMFKKSAVRNAGGYIGFCGMEDYYLWIRMIKKRMQLANLDKVLIKMRTGSNLLARRGGLEYAAYEVRMQLMLYKLEHINILQLLRNLAVRVPVRLVPLSLRTRIYGHLRSMESK